MSFRVVVDSCCEVSENLRGNERIVSVPLGLQIGDVFFVDDKNLVQKELLEHIAAYEGCPKSSCPSPEAFMEAYHCDAERVYVITLSSKLSGSYNSAVLGKELYRETYGEKDIHIVDSHSASAGMTAQLLEIFRLEEQGLSFAEISEAIEVDLNLTMEAKDTAKDSTTQMLLLKIGGSWYITGDFLETISQ